MGGTGPSAWEDVVAAWESLPAAPPRPARPAKNRRRVIPATGPVDATTYLTASLGAPRWLERLQEIEGYMREAEARLRTRWLELAHELRGRPDVFARQWRLTAATWDFSAHNGLVDDHNEYYPVERRLRFDLRARDYVDMWGIGWRREPLDAAWVLRAFPPSLDAALAAAASGG